MYQYPVAPFSIVSASSSTTVDSTRPEKSWRHEHDLHKRHFGRFPILAWQAPPLSRISWPRWRGAGERRPIPLRGSAASPARGATARGAWRGGACPCGTDAGGYSDGADVESRCCSRGRRNRGTCACARAAAAADAANSGPIGRVPPIIRYDWVTLGGRVTPSSFPRPPPINGLCNSRLCRPRLRPLR